jgi:hypothetical protein
VVNAIVQRIEALSGRRLGRGNAIRLFLGRPLARGIINAGDVTDEEIASLKAELFDSLFAAYGAQMAPGLAYMARQRASGRKGADAMKARGVETTKKVDEKTVELKNRGVAERNIVGVIAQHLRLDRSAVAKRKTKARKAQG